MCSLEDAFPNLTGDGQPSGVPFVGGTDDRPTREERKAARKKAKRCKDQMRMQADPDRPAAVRMDAVEAMTDGKGIINLYEPPLGMKPLPVQPPPSTKLLPDADLPSYFGKGEDDPSEEGYADFKNVGGDDESYRLVPDFTKVFDFQGLDKAAGGGRAGQLPEPNLDDAWKPMGPGATYTAYTTEDPAGQGGGAMWGLSAGQNGVQYPFTRPRVENQRPPSPPAAQVPQEPQLLAAQSGEEPILPNGANKREEQDRMLSRIDELMGRIDRMERARGQDTQKELLMFVGTGLFLLASFHFAGRC